LWKGGKIKVPDWELEELSGKGKCGPKKLLPNGFIADGQKGFGVSQKWARWSL